MLKDLYHGEKGQSLTLLVLSMGVIVACLAVAIDGGNSFLHRRQAQVAADAGALAGALALAQGDDAEQAAAEATEYSLGHNTATSVTVTVSGPCSVTVITRRSFGTIFGGVIGQSVMDVETRAGASCVPVAGMAEDVYPIAVSADGFALDTSYEILAGGGPGNFGWLGWGGCTDAGCLCTSLTPPGNSDTYVNPYDSSDHVIDVGDWVPGSTGVANAACVRDALDALIAGPKPIYVVVWDAVQGSGSNLKYRVAGFAELTMESYRLPGQNRVTGCFSRTVEPGEAVAAGSGYGVYRVMPTE